MKTQLEPTGERVIEDAYHRTKGAFTIYAMHGASYRFAEQWCRGKDVLDFGCGSGYGVARLAPLAKHVTGIDVAADAIAFAKARYTHPNLDYQLAQAGQRLPAADASYDVVLSFQVIEHVHDEVGYLEEIRRVLRPGGIFIVITPDRKHRLLPGQKPWNRWHLREYSSSSLSMLVSKHLRLVHSLKMGAPWSVAAIEIRRYRLTKWLTLPVTLPIIPEGLRRRALDTIHGALPKSSAVAAEAPEQKVEYGFDESALIISSTPPYPMNLVVVASRPQP